MNTTTGQGLREIAGAHGHAVRGFCFTLVACIERLCWRWPDLRRAFRHLRYGHASRQIAL